MGFDCESLLAVFMDVCGVLIEAWFIVHDDAEVLKALHHLHWLAVDGGGAMRGGEFIEVPGVKDELLLLGVVEEEVTIQPVCYAVSN